MRTIILWTLAILALTGAVCAEPLVSVHKNGTISAAQFNARLKAVYGPLAPASATGPTDLYKIRYNSHDGKGRPVILSGLLTLPRGGAGVRVGWLCGGHARLSGAGRRCRGASLSTEACQHRIGH